MPAPIIRDIGAWLETEKQAVEADLEAIWVAVKPQALALGKTFLSQVLTSAETYVTSGGNLADAIGVLVAQLPADVKNAEGIVASIFGLLLAKLQATA